MRIGYITYEYPPDIAQGGIATYVEQVAYIMKERGHDVEIFCGSSYRNISEDINGVLVHRCITESPQQFRFDCLSKFEERHRKLPFDIIESPEIHGNALEIKRKFPDLPLVVKLHMALFIQMRLYNYYTTRWTKLRFFLGSLRRGRIRKFGQYAYKTDIDYHITQLADGIVSPSQSLKTITMSEWKISDERISVIPTPYSPSKKLLNIPIINTQKKIVTFIGKLNAHKGVVNLVKAIPLVVERHPDVCFRLIGADSFFHPQKMLMSEFISKKLKDFEGNYNIIGVLKYPEVVRSLESTTLCIFPSIWENFGIVCLEAMSAGRPVIGSREGGMNEILSDGAGILVDPLNVSEIAKSINGLLDNLDLRLEYGKRGRQRVLDNYNSKVIGEMMENQYFDTIQKRLKIAEG